MNLYDLKTKIRHNKYVDLAIKSFGQGRVYGYVYPLLHKLHLDEHSRSAVTLASKSYFEKHQADIDKVVANLADTSSKKCLLTHIAFRVGKPVGIRYSNLKMYFPKDIVHLSDNEVFIDCGAFTGDSIESFLKTCKNRYKKIVAFEPSPHTFSILQAKSVKKCTYLNCGAWEKKDTLTFLFESTVGDRLQNVTFGWPTTPKNATSVQVNAIDNIPECADATFIKMDIEGAELNALKGAEKTIRQNRPTLAICAHHSDKDLLEVPLWLMSLGLDYKFYFRQHLPTYSEIVFYAIPN